MHPIHLADKLYRDAERRAQEAGFSSVDAYVAEVLSQELSGDNFDFLFTPERLAHIDAAAKDIAAGNSYTTEQADAELRRRKAQWLRENSR